MTRIASFDVFDTVLTRAPGSPEAAFLALGRRLSRAGVVAVMPAEFAHAAERRAQQHDLPKHEYALEAESIRSVPDPGDEVAWAARTISRLS